MFASPLRFLRRVLHMRRAEDARALRLSEQRFSAVWEAAADAMALSNAEGIVLAANPAYYQLYGYSPEQILGQSFALIFPADHRLDAVDQYKAIFAKGTDVPVFESRVQTAEGSERIVETRATFITLGDSQTVLLSIIRDITERKHLEAERDQLLAREHAARIEA